MPTEPNYETEQDLPTRQAYDNFWVARIFKYAILVLLVISLFCVTTLFLIELGRNEVLREKVWSILIPQIGTIVIAAVAILGFRRIDA